MVTGPLAEDSLLLVQAAIRWWTQKGFAFVDLPWVVPVQYTNATRPPNCQDVLTPYGAFVASGEQSFLQLWVEQRLGPVEAYPGYVGWTPCVRDEPILDRLHQYAFLKAEWFVPLETSFAVAGAAARLSDLVAQQTTLFAELVKPTSAGGPLVWTRERVGDDQIDILLNGVEVGSYGRRNYAGKSYLYGTALALPRLTLAAQA